ncbi:hypothetical protein [Paramicrobacterium fandaimingii]|uniref:hypothetical protein n=1 Tax=Paramicrobacterium fandaimingii TaxID=2708079 RepID=UPI001422D318|nr:hypothetical protein [Microbacterium fandaimingii]
MSVIAVAAVGLSGCAPAETDADSTPPPTEIGSSQPADPTETATPEPIPGDLDGNGVLSAWEKEQLKKAAPRDYTMSDGSVVEVDPTQPLPEPVKQDIAAKIRPVSQWPKDTIEQEDKQILELRRILNEIEGVTGKKILIVVPSSGGQYGTMKSGEKSYTGISASTDKSAVVREAQEYARNGNYELIVF